MRRVYSLMPVDWVAPARGRSGPAELGVRDIVIVIEEVRR